MAGLTGWASAVTAPVADTPAAVDVPAAVAAPAAAAAETEFTGVWKTRDGKGREFYITLAAGGQASSRWAAAEEQRRNETGTWKIVDGAAQIAWGNGWREVLTRSDAGFVKRAYAPALTLTGAPSNEAPAEKVPAAPGP